MNLKNYTLKQKEYIEELDSTGYYFVHNKTKAKVFYLENKDEIKTFSIGFRTPPKDSTGVAHIVEHTVLSGSRKYRTKEPFMDLVNSSLQTFLNAMTFPDKTIYPIATRNTKDFYNLMDVYLDAVFYPRIYEEEKIFYQEGWHYEMEDLDSPIKYNGVVYNEMRGAYSDPDDQVSEIISEALHPGSTYSHDSGGNPHHIPDLTYEDFLNFHKKYYHPSNSYIFLNGAMDIEEVLKYIDQEYLGNFDYLEVNSKINEGQSENKIEVLDKTYSIGAGEKKENKAYYVYGLTIGPSTSPMDRFMRSILQDIIIESDSSILKDKFLESGLCEDYFSQVSTSISQDFFIVGKNGDGKSLDKFVKIIEDGLRQAVEEKIDQDLVAATLNSFEFSTKDLGIHKGVLLNISCLRSWLYDASPIEALKYKDTLAYIKDNLDKGIVEEYIKEKILNNPRKIQLTVRPNPGEFLEKDKIQEEKLRAYKESLSQEEKENLVKKTQDLFEYQTKLDSKEDKATIPKLDLKDISKGVSHLDTEVIKDGDRDLVFTRAFTNGIYNMTMSFDLKNIKAEELFYVSVVFDLLGSLDTENYSYKDLNNQVDIHTGGISFSPAIYQNPKTLAYKVQGNLRGRAMEDKIDKYLDLVEEIIFRTKFEKPKRIKDLLLAEKADIEASIEQGGHTLIASEVASMLDDSADVTNMLGGRKYLFDLKKVLKDLDQDPKALLEKLDQTYKKIFNQNLTLSLAGKDEYLEKTKTWLEKIENKLSPFDQVFAYERGDLKSIALKSSSNVCYVSDGFKLQDFGIDASGVQRVVAKIISGDYLHTQIRAKGGAYGAGISINPNGNVTTYSYRDPNLDKTFETYDKIGDYLGDLDLDQRDLADFIIATMNQFDPPTTPSQYPTIALARYFTEFGEDDLAKMKDQALTTTLSDIKAYKEVFDQAKDKKVYGVLGSKELIEKSKRDFDQIKTMND
ncbi:insulinase family protein [Neofamilia massiliensis]|uniref:insulinase family protein n=1 Tax=Neofamilia massiliensis TaxID=1673724 RepID=UPI0006BB6CC1|nr:insulinase family protein [Neofamilia massiliensis]